MYTQVNLSTVFRCLDGMSARELPTSITAIRNPNSLLASMAPRPALSESAVFSLILTVRETGRRLAMSDYAVATACTILHRALRVMTTGDEQPLGSTSNAVGSTSVNGEQETSSESIEHSFRHSLGDVDPYVSYCILWHMISSLYYRDDRCPASFVGAHFVALHRLR